MNTNDHSPSGSPNRSPIEHMIVLMLENRSYDHMLGYLPNGRGLTGSEYNLIDPADPASEKVYVSNDAGYIATVDPAHDFAGVEKQLFGEQAHIVQPAPMNGFVKVHIETAKGDVEIGKTIMQCFDPAKLPALSTLAQEFCLCDRWFSSVPGPTWLNRFYAHAATCDGMIVDTARHGYKMKTIYDTLAAHGYSWNIYYGDIPQSLMLEHHWNSLHHFKRFEQFHTDIENGELANYTFIEPRFFNFHEFKATDQHPPHDVRMGEYLIAEGYDCLRNCPFWDKSLLVLLWDEHGGFFDRVPPPGNVPNPDGKMAKHPPFDFTRLGVRVPAILVSPWVEKGHVDSTTYEHASLPATVEAMFNLPERLTKRDKAAQTFEKNLSCNSPRTDTPLTLPVPGEPDEAARHRALLRTNALEKSRRGETDQEEMSQEPLSTFQEAQLELAQRLGDVRQAGTTAGPLVRFWRAIARLARWLDVKVRGEAPVHHRGTLTEHEAAVRIHEGLGRFLER